MKRILILLFTLYSNYVVFSQNTLKNLNNKDLFSKGCSSNNFGEYIPLEYKNLNDITNMSENIKNYLFKRINSVYYKKMHFRNVQVVDSTSFNKYFPNAKMKYRYRYFFCFAYSDSKKGIREYALNLEMNELGNVIKDIELPKKETKNNNLISFWEIKKKAIKIKFYKNKGTKTDLIYDSGKDMMVWKFINEEYKGDGKLLQQILSYNAHNGKYLNNETVLLTVVE